MQEASVPQMLLLPLTAKNNMQLDGC